MGRYTGDHIRREREGLDLIIKMKKSQNPGGRGAELIIFVILPVALAFAVMHFRELKEFALNNQQLSQVIHMVYPEWPLKEQTAPSLPTTPVEGTVVPPAQTESVPSAPVEPGSSTPSGTSGSKSRGSLLR